MIDGAVLGGGLFEVFTCRATLTRPLDPMATSTIACSRPSHGTAMFPMPLTG